MRRLLAFSAVLFLAGWLLVIVFSGVGGSAGPEHALWRVGGLMLYLAVLCFLCCGVWTLGSVIRSGLRRRPRGV